MSTTHPPLQAQGDVAAFKTHARGDTVLPASPEHEQLTPIPTTRDTPGSDVSLNTASASAFRQSNSPYSKHDIEFQGEDQGDMPFIGMTEFEPPDFSNNYLMEAKFGEFPSNEANLYRRESNHTQEPMSATSTTSRSANTISRKSTGLATMSSSQLMSPQLTDAASPPPGFDSNGSPIKEFRLLGGGDRSDTSSDATAGETSQYTVLQTPAATGSSVDVSPSMSQTQGRFSAPMVQVDSYSRGDSPARAPNVFDQLPGSKRRSSSHLAAPAVDSSEDGEYEDASGDPEWQHDQSTVPPNIKEFRQGLDPAQRNQLKDQVISSLDDQQNEATLHAKNVEVSQWLSNSVSVAPGRAGNTLLSAPHAEVRPTTSRRRAKSTSNNRELQAEAFNSSRGFRAAQNASIPGPGLLVFEESGDDDDNDESSLEFSEMPPSLDGASQHGESADYFPSAFEHKGPSTLDAYPWIDPIYFPSHEGTVGQPGTSNDAMMRFAKRARDLETASRAATWGTQSRRLSDSDLQRVFGAGGLFSRLSISRHGDKEPDKENIKEDWRQFKEIVETRVMNFLPKRSNSSSKRKHSEPTRPSSKDHSSIDLGRKESTHKRKESLQSLHDRKESLSATLKKLPSVKRHQSPRLNTSGIPPTSSNVPSRAQGSVSPTENHSPTLKHGVRSLRDMLSRHSSRDASEPNLTALWEASGGPPLPKLSSPPLPSETSPPIEAKTAIQAGEEQAHGAEKDSDEATTEEGVKMDLSPRKDMIIPTYDGFKINIREVNPRLPVYLVERLGQEQLRRYKKLVEFKVKHAQATQLGNCPSGSYCVEKGGQPTYFPSKTSQKETPLSHTGFSTASIGDADDDEDVVQDGLVTEAQFPQGVPMPPVKRLPAEFECPLCFSVKKFTKPSDWSKHVHEDLQPFTCTFHTCPDPKSFKRKADWVRHENERHRQLEWWQCTEEGCAHQCYRRDNFVQHLVREHKMPEPKAKTVKPDNKPAVRGPAKTKSRSNKDFAPEDKVLMMVEKCRRETSKNPIDEPCKFCGNVCNTFKKLTVHLARHMEQISMPVLDLVKIKDVTPDTIISPIEAKLAQTSISPGGQSPYHDSVSVSPFEQPPDLATTVQELPGAFAPVQLNTTFPQPSFGNSTAWGSAAAVSSTLPAQNTTSFDASLTNPWIATNAQFQNSQGPAYQNVSMSSGSFGAQHAASGSNAYHGLPSSMPHGMALSYQDTNSYSIALGQAPNFHVPQYVSGGNVNVGANQHNSQVHYSAKEENGYAQGGSSSQSLYQHQQQMQMHQHAAQQQHQQQHQQQYYGSY